MEIEIATRDAHFDWSHRAKCTNGIHHEMMMRVKRIVSMNHTYDAMAWEL